MKKSSFAAMVLGTVSVVLFALGHVYGAYPGVECVYARRDLWLCGSDFRPYHTDCMEKNGA